MRKLSAELDEKPLGVSGKEKKYSLEKFYLGFFIYGMVSLNGCFYHSLVVVNEYRCALVFYHV